MVTHAPEGLLIQVVNEALISCGAEGGGDLDHARHDHEHAVGRVSLPAACA
jgi:hypothetical protein